MPITGYVLSFGGPTGVGKDSVVHELRKLLEEKEMRNIFLPRHTTRAPRPKERPNIDYIFLAEDEFIENRAAGLYGEAIDYFDGRYYGVEIRRVVGALMEGYVVLGIFGICSLAVYEYLRKNFPKYEMKLVYLIPPGDSISEQLGYLEGNLIRREESQEKIRSRIASARLQLETEPREFMKRGGEVLMNGDFRVAAQTIVEKLTDDREQLITSDVIVAPYGATVTY